MNSLQLDANMDLLITNGSLTVATGDYAVAQNVATALMAFQGEVWYDTSFGMPYLQNIFGGRAPSLAFIKGKIISVAESITDVGSAVVFLLGPGSNRTLGGQVQLTNSAGETIGAVSTTNLAGALPWYVLAASPGATS